MQKNGFIREISLISKFMMSQPGIHILTNISRIMGNQAVTFGQLIESNIRNIFLEKSLT